MQYRSITSCLNISTLYRAIVVSSVFWFLSIISYHFIAPFQSFVEDIFIFSPYPTTYYYAITPAIDDFSRINGGYIADSSTAGKGVAKSTYMLKPTLDSSASMNIHGFSERRVAITYADKCCLHSKSIMCKSAIANGFTECITHTKKSIDPLFEQQHSDILKQKRGGGYWLWKPYVIFKTLLNLNDGDFLMYADAASYFISSAEPLFKHAKALNKDIVVFQLTGKEEYKWTKPDAFVLMNCLDFSRCKNTTQRLATFLFLRKSFNSVRFVSEYLAYASDPRILTDAPSKLGANPSDFVDHRHDQSVLSLLSKKWNLTVFPDPSQYGAGQKGPTPEVEREIGGKLIIHHRYKF